METKNLKSYIKQIKNTLKQKITSEKLVFNTFIYYVFICYLKTKKIINIDIQNKKEYIKTVNFLHDIFNDEYLYYFDYCDLKLENYINNISDISQVFELFSFTEKKMLNDLKVETKDIPITTQVFTPNWICKYLLNNTLGKYISINNLEYVIDNQKINCDITKIKILDPCIGTGNILLYAFELLLEEYKSLGYNKKDAIKLILENNLYGLDIDINAITVCNFIFKTIALEEDIKDIKINIHLIDDPLGSLLLTHSNSEINKILNDKYDIVCTNPPYMGRKTLDKSVTKYLKKHFEISKCELYAAFICRLLQMIDTGYLSMITIHSFMYISSFKALREHLIDNYNITSLMHTGAHTFDNLSSFNALCSAFIIKRKTENINTTFIKLNHIYDSKLKQKEFYNKDNYYYVDINKFKKLDNYSFLYTLDDNLYNLFSEVKIKDIFPLRQGIATGDNKKYVKMFYEVDKKLIGLNIKSIDEALNSNYKYFPYNKGGKFSKWYTPVENVICFNKETYEKLQNQGNHLPSKKYYFKKGITWSLFGFENFSVRYKDDGFLFDVSGSSMFVCDKYIYYVLAFLSSNVSYYLLSLLNPTVNFQVGDIGNLPIIFNDNYLDIVNKLTVENINLCKEYFENQVNSFTFNISPLLKYSKSKYIKDSFTQYNISNEILRNKLKQNEEDLNKIFIDIYKIHNITSNINDRDLTIKQLDEKKQINDFIVYLVKIMLGDIKYQDYIPSKKIKKDKIKSNIIKLLELMFSKETLVDNLKYINKFIDLDKYFDKQFNDYINKIYKKYMLYEVKDGYLYKN